MKLTQVFYRQHIGFMFKKHWLVQGKRVPIDIGAEEYLKSKGIEVEDALEFIKENPEEKERIKIVGPYELPHPLDNTHPDYKEKPCYTLKHTNVLLEGISQAQVLTKTIVAENRLPSKLEELADKTSPKNIHKNVQKAILSANIFDREQVKLPKKKDPLRPAYNFPRILGIGDKRKNIILTNKLLQLIERLSDLETVQNRYVVNDIESCSVFEKEDDLIQFQEISHILVTDNKPVKHTISEKDATFTEIPNLYPVKHTVTMPPEHFYSKESQISIHPVANLHPHTTWLHFNASEVSNLYETPVTAAQVHGRSLIHAFTVATAYAKQIYGNDIKDLPEPVYTNCIQTDGQYFHFGVLELNTLNVDGTEGTKNVWYCKNDLKMYDSCRYLSGIPVLENYNPKVYEYINAFYNY